MDFITLIGLAGGALTTICFLPQVLRTWRLKETKDLSLMMYIMLSVGIFLWLVYGILIRDLPVIAANAVSFVFALILVFFKVRYG